MSAAATEEEVRAFLTTGVDGKPGIPTGLAEPIVEYLAKLGVPLEDVQSLTLEEFSLAYKSVHDNKDPTDYELTFVKKFLGIPVSTTAVAGKEKKPPLTESEDSSSPAIKPLNTYKTVDKDGKLPTGLTRPQTTALDASIHVGSLVTEEEVEGEPFGGDPATTAIAKAKRKAHTGDTWAEIVARNDPDAMVEMLTTLTRDYNLLGMTQEVTILTAARTEMDDIFQGDSKAKLAYMVRYRKKHRGLAFRDESRYVNIAGGPEKGDAVKRAHSPGWSSTISEGLRMWCRDP